MTSRYKTPGMFFGLMMGLLIAVSASQLDAAVISYRLHDHPDGNQSPPTYGLRLDNVFLDDNPLYGGATTFSFDDASSIVLAEIDDVANTMRIFGTARGGTDDGSSYSTEVQVFIDFTYAGLDLTGFDPLNPNLMVPQGSGAGTVTVTQEINNATGLLNNVYDLQSKANSSGNEFNFKDTTHRGFTGINGWGWMSVGDAGGSHDWLFTSSNMLVPEPTSVGLATLGMVTVTMTRRRRRTSRPGRPT